MSPSPIHTVELVDHLTVDALNRALERVAAGPAVGLIVDCRRMTDYDADARRRFVEWHRERRGDFRAVAVVTEKSLWHMIVSAMSLASGQRMRAFDTLAEANTWLASQAES